MNCRVFFSSSSTPSATHARRAAPDLHSAESASQSRTMSTYARRLERCGTSYIYKIVLYSSQATGELPVSFLTDVQCSCAPSFPSGRISESELKKGGRIAHCSSAGALQLWETCTMCTKIHVHYCTSRSHCLNLRRQGQGRPTQAASAAPRVGRGEQVF